MTTYILIGLTVFFAGLIQGLTGFGAALVSIPLLTLMISVKTAVPLVALNGIVLLVIMFISLREHVDFRLVAPLVAGSLPGLPVGIYILKYHDEAVIKLILAVVLISYSLYSLLGKEIRANLGAKSGYISGFISGVLGGAITASGPPVIIYAAIKGWDGAKFKATLTAFFLVLGIFIVTAHAIGGVTTAEALRYFIFCAPCIALGTIIGSRLYHKLNQTLFKKIVYILILIMGLMMIPVWGV